MLSKRYLDRAERSTRHRDRIGAGHLLSYRIEKERKVLTELRSWLTCALAGHRAEVARTFLHAQCSLLIFFSNSPCASFRLHVFSKLSQQIYKAFSGIRSREVLVESIEARLAESSLCRRYR
jgi:hypothetical protein